ncbi:NAD-dependent epimerase/dehydratase family protein [Actinosynnema sp. CS-041913]|uniref:NAD-dependent epimerase/dehydratase family protein n=1 Tax=Actinosynnema sp. CS-041913 TaxID=3239917 RepID=UPI003D8CF4E0
MRLLLLGGTEFVGRATAEEALARGWEVTVFHRGHHEPPPGVTALHGDRGAPDGLAALGRGEWDAVVDTWSGAPRAVRDAARLLADRVGHCAYVSSRGIYDFPVPPPLTEDRPVVDGSPDDDDVDYRRAKRGGELAVTAAFGERALVVRPGLVFGPRETSRRLPWWLRRVARGGRVLAPGPRELGLQYIDSRDLAAWVLDAAERGLGGVHNAVCPPGHATTGDLLDACAAVTGSGAELCWTAPERVLAAGIRPWTDLPIWLPPGEMHELLHRTDVSKAVAAGLRCRPLAETVADTWDWLRGVDGPLSTGSLPRNDDLVGLDPLLEAQVLSG